MTPPNPLQQLRDLDRTSPQFRPQLVDILRGKEYQDVVPSLQGDDLTWLVEYLDSVSLQPITLPFALNAGVDRPRYLRSCKCAVSGIPA